MLESPDNDEPVSDVAYNGARGSGGPVDSAAEATNPDAQCLMPHAFDTSSVDVPSRCGVRFERGSRARAPEAAVRADVTPLLPLHAGVRQRVLATDRGIRDRGFRDVPVAKTSPVDDVFFSLRRHTLPPHADGRGVRQAVSERSRTAPPDPRCRDERAGRRGPAVAARRVPEARTEA